MDINVICLRHSVHLIILRQVLVKRRVLEKQRQA